MEDLNVRSGTVYRLEITLDAGFDRHICTKLDFLRRVHPNLDRHLDLIGKYGTKNWFSKRGVHYRW